MPHQEILLKIWIFWHRKWNINATVNTHTLQVFENRGSSASKLMHSITWHYLVDEGKQNYMVLNSNCWFHYFLLAMMYRKVIKWCWYVNRSFNLKWAYYAFNMVIISLYKMLLHFVLSQDTDTIVNWNIWHHFESIYRVISTSVHHLLI